MLTHPQEDIVTRSLDPENWDETRALAHQMVDDMLNYLQASAERPAWRPMDADARAVFTTPLPDEPEGLGRAYADFSDKVLPYPLGDTHPRFFGYVNSNGTVEGMLAQMLAAGMNSNTGGAAHAANLVEQQVIDWMKGAFGYPAGASGVLTSGGSMANLIGIAVARHVHAEKLGVNVRQAGIGGLPARMRLYVSAETHSSVQRAVETLGLGTDSLCVVPVDDAFRMDIAALEAAVAADRQAGMHPFCVVGSAGTTNTGSIDDLNALADLCEREGLWFHVDGAIGAVGALSGRMRPLIAGMERADSLAFDMHKWLFVNYTVGCVLVRDAAAHRAAFALTPPYLKRAERGLAADGVWFSDYGVELSREFRGLKVWMMLKSHGSARFGEMIDQNIALAGYLASLVQAEPLTESLAPVAMHIVNFRYAPPGLSETQLDALNDRIVIEIQERGIAVPTRTVILGRYAIRVCVNNHRTTAEDIRILFRAVLEIGAEVLPEYA
jgi:aromatic-L-amino-acid/L-tryptophan decarboxylase